MITELSAQNFKSWENTGKLQIAPLTGFFGANSSGKTSIFQTLLMLKQTAERPPEWDGVIDFGDERSVVNLSNFNEVIHRHKSGLSLDISVSWQLPEKLIIGGGGIPGQALPRTPRSSNRLEINALSFSTTIISAGNDSVAVDGFGYMSDGYEFFGIVRDSDSQYKLICPPNFKLQGAFSSSPFRCYGIRDGSAKVPDTPFLSFERAFKNLFSRIHHLSPLREPPRHQYAYGGEHPKGVGQYGEQAISALLSGRIRLLSVDEQILKWLQRLELIDSYRLQADFLMGKRTTNFDSKSIRTVLKSGSRTSAWGSSKFCRRSRSAIMPLKVQSSSSNNLRHICIRKHRRIWRMSSLML